MDREERRQQFIQGLELHLINAIKSAVKGGVTNQRIAQIHSDVLNALNEKDTVQ